MIKKIFNEQKAKFDVFNSSAKQLIWSNLLFGLFNPFFLIFSNTFIYNTTKGDLKFNIIYCACSYVGIIIGFAVNGNLTRRFHIKNLIAVGELLMFIAISAMFFLPSQFLTSKLILIFGTATGMGVGVYWASRNYLTIVNTHDGNRDFFAGLDFIFISSGRIITSLFVGLYIGEGIKHKWFSSQFAYKSALIFAFFLVVFSSIIILRTHYNTTRVKRFFYLKYSYLWNCARKMVVLTGFFQGALFVIPPVFIMKYIGNETAVGSISSVSYLLAIIIVYIVSSRSGAEHRTGIMASASSLFTAGTLFFIVFICTNSFIATSILTFLMFMAEPIMNFPLRATIMKAIDDLKHIEKRDDYTYLFDIEFFTAVGRVASLVLFYFIYCFLSINIALTIYLVIVSALQFLNIPLSKKVNGK